MDVLNLFHCDFKTCGKKFNSRNKIYYHMMSCHKEKHLACPKCDMMFALQNILNKHMKHVHNRIKKPDGKVGNFPCDQCEKQFESKALLRNHKSRNHGEKLDCHWPDCHYVANSIRQLQEHHESRHEDKSSWSCPLCEKIYESKKGLIKHAKIKHGEEEAEKLKLVKEAREFELAEYAKEQQARIDAMVYPPVEPDFIQVGEEFICNKCQDKMPSRFIAEYHQAAHEMIGD